MIDVHLALTSMQVPCAAVHPAVTAAILPQSHGGSIAGGACCSWWYARL
jgi:hypothetical protein